jgi:hypothetical protein
MKLPVIVVTGLLMSILSYAADDTKLEMWEEPSHQLVFEQGNTRILDIRIVPGVTSEYHLHRYATVYIVMQDALLQGQEHGEEMSARVTRPYRSPGAVMDRADYVTKNSYHRVMNNDDRTFHLVSIVNSAAIARDDESATATDDYLNNKWFAEHRITLEPGARSAELRFTNDTVLTQPHKGLAHVVENGITHSVRSMPGAWSLHAANSSFQVVNDSDEAQEFILIEVRK